MYTTPTVYMTSSYQRSDGFLDHFGYGELELSDYILHLDDLTIFFAEWKEDKLTVGEYYDGIFYLDASIY